MDAARVAVLRDLLGSTGWVDRTRTFARVMRRSTATPGGLLLVGTPQEEPWHLAAHLDDESRYSGIAELSPTLVRWNAPPDAPPHLSFTLERLEAARRGETVFVVAEDAAPERLLDRVSDARKHGATVLSLDGGDAELQGPRPRVTHDRAERPRRARAVVRHPAAPGERRRRRAGQVATQGIPRPAGPRT